MTEVVWGVSWWRSLVGLADQVGEHLTGFRVSVVPGVPRAKGAWAEVVRLPPPAKGMSSGALVTVRPDVDGVGNVYWLLLHELAHLVCGHLAEQKSWAVAELPAGSLSVKAVPFEEAEAAAVAAGWDAWAEQQLPGLAERTGDVRDKLRVLLSLKVYRAEEV